MKVWEFEQKILELEEVRIVVRAPKMTEIGDYPYSRCSSSASSVTEWLRTRVESALGAHQAEVVDGNGACPHGRTKMSTLRESYER